MATKGTDSHFMDFVAPVFHMDFELKHALFGVTLSGNITILIRLK